MPTNNTPSDNSLNCLFEAVLMSIHVICFTLYFQVGKHKWWCSQFVIRSYNCDFLLLRGPPTETTKTSNMTPPNNAPLPVLKHQTWVCTSGQSGQSLLGTVRLGKDPKLLQADSGLIRLGGVQTELSFHCTHFTHIMTYTYRRRVVSLSKTLYSPKVLVNYPGSGGSVPTWLKNCWLGR